MNPRENQKKKGVNAKTKFCNTVAYIDHLTKAPGDQINICVLSLQLLD